MKNSVPHNSVVIAEAVIGNPQSAIDNRRRRRRGRSIANRKSAIANAAALLFLLLSPAPRAWSAAPDPIDQLEAEARKLAATHCTKWGGKTIARFAKAVTGPLREANAPTLSPNRLAAFREALVNEAKRCRTTEFTLPEAADRYFALLSHQVRQFLKHGPVAGPVRAAIQKQLDSLITLAVNQVKLKFTWAAAKEIEPFEDGLEAKMYRLMQEPCFYPHLHKPLDQGTLAQLQTKTVTFVEYAARRYKTFGKYIDQPVPSTHELIRAMTDIYLLTYDTAAELLPKQVQEADTKYRKAVAATVEKAAAKYRERERRTLDSLEHCRWRLLSLIAPAAGQANNDDLLWTVSP